MAILPGGIPQLIGMLASTAGAGVTRLAQASGSSISHKLAGSIAAATTNALTRELDIAANLTGVAAGKSALPSPEAILNCIYARTMTQQDGAACLAAHGIILPAPDAINNNRGFSWQAVQAANEPTFPMAFERKRYLQSIFAGSANQLPLLKVLQLEGLGAPDQFDAYVNEKENLELGVLVKLWLNQQITYQQFVDRSRLLGVFPQEAQMILQAAFSRPGISQATDLLLRGVIDLPKWQKYATSDGFFETDVQTQLLTFQNTMPGPSDVFGSAGRLAWDQAFVDRWSLDGEEPPQLDTWSRRLGFNYSAGIGPFGAPDANSPSWKNILWRDHWRLMDIGAALQAHRRFRGDPNDATTWSDPAVPPLTDSDLDALMAANGIPPGARPYLLALGYTPIGLRHLRMIQSFNPQPRQWVYDRYQDLGFTPDNAVKMGDALLNDIDPQRRVVQATVIAAAKKWLATVVDGFKGGAITRPMAEAAINSMGVPVATTMQMLDGADIERNLVIIRAVIARAKSDWFAGRTDLAGAQQRMLSAGIDPDFVTKTLAAWQATRGEGKVHLATEKILRMVRLGFISASDALVRLNNLGWAAADELLLLAEVQQQIDKDKAAAQAHADAATAKQTAAIQRLLNQNAANQNRLLSRLRALASPETIMKWVRSGVWTPAQATARLLLLGFDQGTIDSMLAQAALDAAGGPTTSASTAAQKQAKLKRLYPIARTVNFYRDGIWSRADAASKLDLVGVPLDEANALLDEVDAKKAAAGGK